MTVARGGLAPLDHEGVDVVGGPQDVDRRKALDLEAAPQRSLEVVELVANDLGGTIRPSRVALRARTSAGGRSSTIAIAGTLAAAGAPDERRGGRTPSRSWRRRRWCGAPAIRFASSRCRIENAVRVTRWSPGRRETAARNASEDSTWLRAEETRGERRLAGASGADEHDERWIREVEPHAG